MLWSFGEGLYDTSYFPICTYSFLWRTVPQKEPLRVLDCGFLTVFQIGLDSDTYKLNTIYIKFKILLLSALLMLIKICLWGEVSYP